MKNQTVIKILSVILVAAGIICIMMMAYYHSKANPNGWYPSYKDKLAFQSWMKYGSTFILFGIAGLIGTWWYENRKQKGQPIVHIINVNNVLKQNCKICLEKKPKYITKDLRICEQCVKEINEANPEPNIDITIQDFINKYSHGTVQQIFIDGKKKATGRGKELEEFERAIKIIRANKNGIKKLIGKNDERLKDVEWKKRRRLVINRDGYRCYICKKNKNLDLHHIIALRNMGTNNESNLIYLCRSCHEREHGFKMK